MSAAASLLALLLAAPPAEVQRDLKLSASSLTWSPLPGAAAYNVYAGNVVTLAVDRPLASGGLVSYGYSADPMAPWLKDQRGVALPCFKDVPLTP